MYSQDHHPSSTTSLTVTLRAPSVSPSHISLLFATMLLELLFLYGSPPGVRRQGGVIIFKDYISLYKRNKLVTLFDA